MKTEDLMQALNSVDDTYLQETLSKLETPRVVRPRRKLGRSLLLVAVLILLMAPAAWAAYNQYLHPRVPVGGVHFRILDDKNEVHEGVMANVAMVINVDARPEATDVVMRFGWLPEGAPSPDVAYYGTLSRYYDLLDFFQDHERYPGWVNRPLEELLAEAGMSAEEAKTWYTGYSWEKDNGALLSVTVMDAAALYEEDLLLGSYGGEASIVRQEAHGKYEMLEIQLDYTELYRKVAEKNGYEASQQDILKNYLFLYEPEEQYLIFAGGSDSDFSFETLEKIAENMEIKVTSFPARPMREERSYLFLDLGRG